MRQNITSIITIFAAAAILSGCQSTPKAQPQAAPSQEVKYQSDKDLQKVWLAPGFDFNGFDTLYIAPTKYEAKERPNEVEIRTWAMDYLPQAMAESIRKIGIIPNVVTKESDIKPDAKVVKLENRIVEYEKGGGGARAFAGVFGGGQPILRVQGTMTSTNDVLFRYEAKRSGESAGARMSGMWLSDKDIQRQDIEDLAFDLGDFIRRTAKHVAK